MFTRQKKTIMIALILIMVGVIIVFVLTASLGIQQVTYAGEPIISPNTKDFLGRFSESLSEVAKVVKPSVVNISITSTTTMQESPSMDVFKDAPFFRRFFGDQFGHSEIEPQKKFKSSSFGSGVIVTEDGYILTNNHVIKDADEIKVILYDKREFKGKVIGADPKSALAIVKIDAKDLPAIKIGDSDKLKIGEFVLAFGNPYSLGHTYTMGIVSALGRANVGIADYEDFIQTSLIGLSGSGGALVNKDGELIGINTAIFAERGNVGIGFAIPSNMAKFVMDNIIKHGKVIWGWLGIHTQNITPNLALQFGIKENKGALVATVIEDSPAEKAGLRQGDLIIEYDSRHVEDAYALINVVAKTVPGKTVEVKIIRNGKERTLIVTLERLPEATVAAKRDKSAIALTEKETVKHILTYGPKKRFVVKDLSAQERAQQGVTTLSFGGPPPGTTFVIFREDMEKGGYSWTSNRTILGIGPQGFQEQTPDFSDFLEGTVVRFLGKIELGTCPLEACTFEGDFNHPLSFVGVRDKGLVYLGGKGTVNLKDGRKVELP